MDSCCVGHLTVVHYILFEKYQSNFFDSMGGMGVVLEHHNQFHLENWIQIE